MKNVRHKIVPGVVLLMAPSHFIMANKTTVPVVSMGTGGHIASPVRDCNVEKALRAQLCKQSKTW